MTFDFTGVTNLTDSFVHTCFGNMAEEHGEDFVKKVRFKGCSPLVKSFLSIALSEGLKKHREMHAGRLPADDCRNVGRDEAGESGGISGNREFPLLVIS